MSTASHREVLDGHDRSDSGLPGRGGAPGATWETSSVKNECAPCTSLAPCQMRSLTMGQIIEDDWTVGYRRWRYFIVAHTRSRGNPRRDAEGSVYDGPFVFPTLNVS